MKTYVANVGSKKHIKVENVKDFFSPIKRTGAKSTYETSVKNQTEISKACIPLTKDPANFGDKSVIYIY